jgi:membrane-bound serine protease (ClpP class)
MDPTLLYILLMVGLWVGATSFFIPGTGLAELAAVLLLGGSFYLMAGMATNWAALLLLVVSVAAFILIPLARPKLTRWAELALVTQVIGSLFLFRGTAPNPVAIFGMVALAFIYNRFLLVPFMDRMRTAPSVGNEQEELLGAQGRVLAALTPPNAGTAYINGEPWTIRADVALKPGDVVRVVEVHGLEAQVERVKAKRPPQPEEEQEEIEYHNGHVPAEANGTSASSSS